MKKILLGILIGIFLCVSFFEIIHRTVEIDGWRMCAVMYDKLNKEWHPDFTYQVRIVYKFFAIPIKTVWLALSEDEIAKADGLGKDICEGNWKFIKINEWRD